MPASAWNSCSCTLATRSDSNGSATLVGQLRSLSEARAGCPHGNFKRTPLQMFHLPQHLVVPLFQRPYVWDEDEQWAPLWQDVRRLAELRLARPVLDGHALPRRGRRPSPRRAAEQRCHGEQHHRWAAAADDAAAADGRGWRGPREAGCDAPAGQLERLTHNDGDLRRRRDTRLKVRHTQPRPRRLRRGDGRRAAGRPRRPDARRLPDRSGARVLHRAVDGWLGDADARDVRAHGPTRSSTSSPGAAAGRHQPHGTENSQEIFETLNARGTPLTAADLIRNFVFQRLEAEGADTRAPTPRTGRSRRKFWETEVSVGRYLRQPKLAVLQPVADLPRRRGDQPQSTFTRFKQYVEHESGQKMSDLLPTIKQQAEQYEAWTIAAADQDRQLTRRAGRLPDEGQRGRAAQATADLAARARPATSRATSSKPSSRAAESWLVRRQLLRLTASTWVASSPTSSAAHRDAPAERTAPNG